MKTVKIMVLVIAVAFAGQFLSSIKALLTDEISGESHLPAAIERMATVEYSALLPSMSPYLAIISSIATHSASLYSIVCLPVLFIALLRGRWFCRNACPAGLITEYAGKVSHAPKNRYRAIPLIGQWIVFFALGSAILGYPVFVWLDPLALFNGFIAAWRAPLTVAGMLPAAGFISIVILSLFCPKAWCFRLCPLGFTQKMLGNLGAIIRGKQTPGENGSDVTTPGRRMFIAAICGGVTAMIAKHIAGLKTSVIRPPGAVPEPGFAAVCVRCGNCSRVCPEKIIHPDLGTSGAGGLLTPSLSFGPKGYCRETCNECNKVCPSGAIKRISLEEKKTIAIGTAEVIRPSCISWQNDSACMVCDEYCPYNAFKRVRNSNGVICPVVDAELCRGCGLCELVCPADKLAIVVQPITQRKLQTAKLDDLLTG